MPKVKCEWIIHKEANEMVAKLCEMHPRHLGHITPATIGCVSISNKDKGDTQDDCRIRGVRQPDSLFSSVQYVIVFFQECWDKYNSAQRAAMLFRNLIRIPDAEDGPDGSVLKQDLQDIRVLVKAFGVDYMDSPSLPDLTQVRGALGE